MALLILIVPIAMYFLMIRPQQKRLKEQKAMQAAIDVGDEVITNSGIYGFITGVEGDKFWLEIDDDVQIRIARAAVQGKVPSSTTDAPALEQSKATVADDDIADES